MAFSTSGGTVAFIIRESFVVVADSRLRTLSGDLHRKIRNASVSARYEMTGRCTRGDGCAVAESSLRSFVVVRHPYTHDAVLAI
jgi:hypothetical protein